MSHEKYAFAVAAVRTKENALVGTDFIEQLLSSKDYEAVRVQLVERGFINRDSSQDDTLLQEHLIQSFNMLKEIAPNPELLNFLIIKNDFHNLKAALKCSFSALKPDSYFLSPCLFDTEEISKAVSERKFDYLPEMLRQAAIDAHEVFMRTQDGQYSDIIIDAAALVAIRQAGRESQSKIINDVTELICAAANINTALRAARTQKDKHFLDRALIECDTLTKGKMVDSALKGEEELLSYIRNTNYAKAVELLASKDKESSSLSAFEKWFDDRLISVMQDAKFIFFGPEPLAAYYLARESELRNIRILLSGKRHDMEDDVIRERMRKLYV